MKRRISISIIAMLVCLTAYRIFIFYSRSEIRKSDIYKTYAVKTEKAAKKDLWETIEVAGEVRGFLEAKVFCTVPGKVSGRTKAIGANVVKNEVILRVDRDEPALEFSLVVVKSPISGVLTRFFVNEGETVFPGYPLAEVAAIEKVKIVVQISEKDFPKVKDDIEAQFYVDSYPNKPFRGRLSNISQSLDMVTRTITAEVITSNPGYLLKPGMFANVEIFIQEHKDALSIPHKAVIYSPGFKDSVFVIKEDGTVNQTVVSLGVISKGFVQVIEGLKEGDEIVLEGQYNLREGAKVSVLHSEAVAAPEVSSDPVNSGSIEK